MTADAHVVRELSTGWELTATEPGQCAGAGALGELQWLPARVPGTAAMAMATATEGYDGRDWWFRTSFEAEPPGEGEELALVFEAIATVSEVYLNGVLLLSSDSMFASYTVAVEAELVVTSNARESSNVPGALTARASNELAICCRALTPLLAPPRRPRARWRTKVVSEGNLRFFRTMLLGRTPGVPTGPPVVGPWRPVRLERRRGAILEELELRPRIEDGKGILAARVQLRTPSGAPTPTAVTLEVSGHGAAGRGPLPLEGQVAQGELVVGDVQRWWPHTHGEPNLYGVTMFVEAGGDVLAFDLGLVGFRELRCGDDVEREGIQPIINGVPVFARGAVWTPLDLAQPTARDESLREVLGRVVSAGMNMLRVPGTACYEGDEFYDLCDELGILVWQDFMFANFDYPEQDDAFMSTVTDEVRQVLARLGGRPSLAVLCGGSEVAQQVAMLGLDPELANGPLFGQLLPALVEDARVDASYVRSAPSGGDLPFRTDRGVANYYGVGAYRRPLEDVRRAEVRFAAECLAFANVPDEEALEAIGVPPVHHPAWKAGVPRDVGAGWDFEDVRDHYLRLLFDVDPVALRSADPERYLELSRAVTGEVMAEVFGEWRRPASQCGGGLVVWMTDLFPGAGWGLLDHRGVPKEAYRALSRVLAPVAAWSTDEGLGGVHLHVANDRPEPLLAELRFALYRDLEICVGEHRTELQLEPHSGFDDSLERLLGRFVDASWAYRFGPPAQDVIVVSLEQEGHLLSQSFRFPAGRPVQREPASRLGVRAILHEGGKLSVSSERLLYGVRVTVLGFEPADDAFSVEPGHRRELELTRRTDAAGPATGSITALNLSGRVVIEREHPRA
ncbi:MAG: glycoside hydrolase family 2 protein [Actinomycetota bacterium]|nr:glycoside hydrolase family 2 protein [Actinomycetota bacterium]